VLRPRDQSVTPSGALTDGLDPGATPEPAYELPASARGADPKSGDETATLANASNRQLLVNFATGYAGLIVALLLSLFLTPITLRYLGSSTYGLWIVITAVGGYVGLLDAGVSTATAQMVASATAVRDYKRVADILASAQVFFAVTGALAIGLILALVPLLGSVFSVGNEPLSSARLALLLTGMLTVVSFLTAVPQCALYGAGRNDRSSLVGIGIGILTQGGQITAVLLGGGLVGLLSVSVAGALLNFGGTRLIARRLGLLGQHNGRPSRPMLRELLRSGRRNAVVALAGTVAYSLDAVVIGIILPVRQVAPYDIGLSTANFVRSMATTATGLLLPAYAHSFTLKDDERQFRLFSRAVLASMCITVPMVVALIAFGQPLMRLWLGTVPPHTYQVLVALNIVLLIQLPGAQAFVFLTGTGRNKVLGRMALPAALVNLGLSIGATFWFGPIGPALGSVPEVVIVDFLICPVMCCHAMGVPTRRYVREAMLPVIAPLIAAIAAALALRALVGDTSKYLAPVEAVGVTLVAWAVLAPVLAKTDPLFHTLLHRGWTHMLGKVRR
jgi:O-antigen/teichoic acid export membrane protein